MLVIQTIHAAEIRDAAFRGHTGAAKKDNIVAGLHHLYELLYLGLHTCTALPFSLAYPVTSGFASCSLCSLLLVTRFLFIVYLFFANSWPILSG